MIMRRLTWVVCLLFVTGLLQASLAAADNSVDRERDLTRVRKKIETLRAWQLTEELDLDEETSSQLFPAMKEADRERWKLEKSNRDLVREMARSLESRKPDDRKINRILNELQANRAELIKVEERHMEKVREILSPSDTARYLLFQIKFQREIKKKAAEALRSRRMSDDGTVRERWDSSNDMDRGSGGSGNDSGSSSGGGGSGGRR